MEMLIVLTRPATRQEEGEQGQKETNERTMSHCEPPDFGRKKGLSPLVRSLE
jgi:hypothetical protein